MSQTFHWPDLSHLAPPTGRGPGCVVLAGHASLGGMTIWWSSLQQDRDRDRDLKEGGGNRNANGKQGECPHLGVRRGAKEGKQKEAAGGREGIGYRRRDFKERVLKKSPSV